MNRSSAQESRDCATFASAAASLLRRLREECSWSNPSELRKTADLASHVLLTTLIRQTHPDDRIRSEEELATESSPNGAGPVWIIDPLDGTREFAEQDRRDWAVHVALAEGGHVRCGAVALPAENLVFSTDSPFPRVRRPAKRPRLVVSRSRPPAIAHALAEELPAELVTLGSAGAKTVAVIRGQAEIYVHDEGQYEWDTAAPAAVAAAAGYHVSRLGGSPLLYDQPDPWLPDFLVCHPSLTPTVLRAIRRLRAPSPAVTTSGGADASHSSQR